MRSWQCRSRVQDQEELGKYLSFDKNLSLNRVVASVNGTPVKSIADLNGANTKIYRAHYGMTQA